MKIKIELVNGENYRPAEILVNGEKYSMDAYLKKYGYNWRTSASGNILYYRSDSGKDFAVRQSVLFNLTKNERRGIV